MNFAEEEDSGNCNNKEEQEEEEELEEEEEEEEEEEDEPVSGSGTTKIPFPSPSSSTSSSVKYKNFMPQNRNLWQLGSFDSQQDYKHQEPALNFDDKKLELVDLSLGNINETDHHHDNNPAGGAGASGSTEKEHMFDKVVTPSDVGKLNRLVIPKQHAEKYFPLDSSSNEKGLLLNFEDRNGKPWRFRYSYWNSSQSYVMTKGWSRFVKEKKLDAGDIVSFQRGVGEAGKHRLYIDWRRRPNAPDPSSFAHFELQNQLHLQQSVRWGRLYSLPQSLSIPRQYEQPQFQHLNYSVQQPYSHHHRHHQYYHNYHHQQPEAATGYGNAPAAAGQYYLRPPGTTQYPIASSTAAIHQPGGAGGDHMPMVIDSVPVVHGKTVGKRLRLFGVNMECPPPQDESSSSSSIAAGNAIPHATMVGSLPVISSYRHHHHHHLASSSLPPLQLRGVLPSTSPTAPTTMQQQATAHEFSKKGKTSLSFDLDL